MPCLNETRKFITLAIQALVVTIGVFCDWRVWWWCGVVVGSGGATCGASGDRVYVV